MFTIFTTNENLLTIFKENSTWWKILRKTPQIVHSEEITPNNPLYRIYGDLRKAGIRNWKAKGDFINNISGRDKEMVLDESNGAFLLNIPLQDVSIYETYGVFCKSIQEQNPIRLADSGFHIDTADDTIEHSWRYILNNQMASNALLIVDRYLFSSDPQYPLNVNIKNITDILNNILPRKANSDLEYHISIVFDFYQLHDYDRRRYHIYTYEDFAYYVSQKIREIILRDYQYTIELISISKGDENWESYGATHDRKIITNYYIVDATHQLKAFYNGNSILSQTINFNYLFSSGINDNDRGSTYEITQRQTIDALLKAISQGVSYFYSDEEEEYIDESFSNVNRLKNRLFYK